jgi:multidrug efflux pump subunit AcrB
MAIRNITLEDLTNAIKNGTSYTGAGQFDGPHRSFLLQPQGQLTTAAQYDGLIIGQSNCAPVYLKDVATAKQSVQDSMRAGANSPMISVWSLNRPKNQIAAPIPEQRLGCDFSGKSAI